MDEQKSLHGSCTVGDDVDEDGMVECDECGMLWPAEPLEEDE